MAIATEGLPSEAELPYVDFAQMARDKSVNAWIMGEVGVPETFGLEAGKAYDDVVKARAELERLLKAKRFDPVLHRKYLASIREFGEPAVKTMMVSRFVRPYPHLGCMSPTAGGEKDDPNRTIHNRVFQALRLWFDMSVDGCIHEGTSWNIFMDAAPWDSLDVIRIYRKRAVDEGTRTTGKYLTEIHYGKFALARFWQANLPHQVEPKDFQKGDIVRWRLKDGRILFVTRSAPTTLRWAFADGPVLAELDLFDGWQHDQLLMKDYAPTFLKIQLDGPAGR